jgi:hypothetical protein
MALFLDALAETGAGETQVGAPAANYMLRYLVRSETAKQQTEGLIEYCLENHIREVLLFNGNHWSPGWNLPTLEEAKVRVEVLRPVVRRLREAGLHVSINMLTTIGHADAGRDERKRFSWQFMVGDDGAECHAIPCPIDPQWKSYVVELYALNASLEPEFIYVDDDFRYHNHSPAAWGCFCPLHVAEMERRTGKRLPREDLVHQILSAEPQPTIERQEWFKLCGDSILEALRIIAAAVQNVSPKTHMGLMCSDPNTHAAEGRRWLDMVGAMSASGNKPALRPTYAAYSETVYLAVPEQISPMRKLQPLLAAKMRFTPELENWPGTRFTKSVALTRLQMALSFFIASPDLTINNILDFFEGGFQYDNADYDRMLRDFLGYYDTLAAYAGECRKERGLEILWDSRPPLHRHVTTDRMADLPAPRCWEGVLDILGFATTFYPEEVRLADRGYLEERSDEELRSLLRGKVLMDGDSAAFLVERGFGAEIGLKSCRAGGGANAERLVNREFAGEYWNHDEETWSLTKYLLEPVEQAILVSKLIGPDETYTRPGMMLFENYQGGRVGIIPFDGSTGDFDMRPVFRTWKRQRALRKMLEWINKGPLPLFVEEAPNVFPLRRDGEMAVVVGIANLTADPLPQVKFRIAVPFEGKPALELLTFSSKGPLSNFHATATDGYLRFQLPVGIAPLELACFRISAS